MKLSNPLQFETISPHLDLAKTEEQVLAYWDQIHAFERSVSERPEAKPYVFYDGPPFATGTPHYGHILGSVMKDIIPRYWTMRGYRVERRWGWDCHGLPIENLIEKELGLKGGKKGIEAYGIAKFNAACRAAILRFDRDWEIVIRRIGRWVDMQHSYKTMDLTYMESVWWAFKEMYQKNLVYQGKKVILFCPRCSTPLSNFEIAMDNSYADVTEPGTTYKFPVKGEEKTYLLAWSTTPWNKLATPALAVNPDLAYVKVRQGEEFYLLAESRLEMLSGDYEIVDHFIGKDLEKLEFIQLYDFYPERGGARAGAIVADDFVTAADGTGIVTLAIYGEDDYRVMLKHNIQLVEHIDEAGKLKPEVTPWAGMYILKANPLIDEDLTKRKLIYHIAPLTHSVPVCYRCGTRLYYAPLPAWFIDIQKLKPELVKHNSPINWYPAHLKLGRFGKGLETAPDWNISRSRYWGTPMPIWMGGKTGKMRLIGSIEELETWAVNPGLVANLTDLHRESIDDLELWVDDQKTEKGTRIKEVFDCWIESGSMPFAAEHYPFDHREKFEARFPAQYICEYIAQTRAWFYTLHVMAVSLFDKPSFQNALTTGTIMSADGSKMSKSKHNFPDPLNIINHYGVDSLRLYLAASPLMKTAQNVNFNELGIDEIRKRVFLILWNVFAFYKLYDNHETEYTWPEHPASILDQWLISGLEDLTLKVETSLNHYDVVTATKALMAFVDDLSQWWLRLSRDRLRHPEANHEAMQVFRTALYRYSLCLAPFAPFFAEIIYQNLGTMPLDSVHLEFWPRVDKSLINQDQKALVTELRQVVEKTHALRKLSKLKARQPLAKLSVTSLFPKPDSAWLEFIKQELNVKAIDWLEGQELTVNLDTQLTASLIAEGQAREVIRQIMDARKLEKTSFDEWIDVSLPEWPVDYTDLIKEKVKAHTLVKGPQLQVTRML